MDSSVATQLSPAEFGRDDDDYVTLDKLSLALAREPSNQDDGSFLLCFWVYFVRSSEPGVVIRQGRPNAKSALPFLTIGPDRHLCLYPLPPPLESETETDSSHRTEPLVSLVSEHPCAFEKWTHIGCEVNPHEARLFVDSLLVACTPLSGSHGSSSNPLLPPTDTVSHGSPVLLSGGDGSENGGGVQAIAHYVRLLKPSNNGVQGHYGKNPPIELSLDGSSGQADDSELEESGDGVLNVVGGKASCRRNFTLDVILLDALGTAVHRDFEIAASLAFADDGTSVARVRDDAEAPLLTTLDGVEYSAQDRPMRMQHGRASFKLKISQLSSKCENRLFRVVFHPSTAPNFPFLRTVSRPIRCVSRNRHAKQPFNLPLAPKRSLPTADPSLPLDRLPRARISSHEDLYSLSGGNLMPPPGARGTHHHPEPRRESSGDQSEASETQAHLLPPLLPTSAPSSSLPSGTFSGADFGRFGAVFGGKNGETEGKLVGSAVVGPALDLLSSMDVRGLRGLPAVPDTLVMKYCLESMCFRSSFLGEVVPGMGEREVEAFAVKVSQVTRCKHNGYQIMMAKGLLSRGEEVWGQAKSLGGESNEESQPWSTIVNLLEENLISLSGCQKRRFSDKDKEFLRRIAGCSDISCDISAFRRVWQWLYPVVLTLSLPPIREAWESSSSGGPQCLEGLVTREEAEELLKTPAGLLCGPGTFLVRFASSRLWPHPDSGALVITYVGNDEKVHHKLLSIDDDSGNDNKFTSGNSHTFIRELMKQPELNTLNTASWDQKLLCG